MIEVLPSLKVPLLKHLKICTLFKMNALPLPLVLSSKRSALFSALFFILLYCIFAFTLFFKCDKNSKCIGKSKKLFKNADSKGVSQAKMNQKEG